MKKNPFETLGIAPILVEELNNENLAKIVQSQYRQLQLIYHPDKEGGVIKKSEDISEAYSLIKDINSESFAEAKKQYLRTKGRTKKAQELEEQLKTATATYQELSDVFMMYALNFSGLAEDKRPNIFCHDNLLMIVYDVVLAYNIGGPKEISLNREESAKKLLRLLKFQKNNKLYEKEANTKRYGDTNKKVIGSIPMVFMGVIKSVLYNKGNRERSLIEFEMPPKFRRYKEGLKDYFGGLADKTKVYKQMDLGDFKAFLLPHLTPYIAIDHYLFTAEKTEKGIGVNIEGKIVRVEKI